jgi:hypothetical protein
LGARLSENSSKPAHGDMNTYWASRYEFEPTHNISAAHLEPERGQPSGKKKFEKLQSAMAK